MPRRDLTKLDSQFLASLAAVACLAAGVATLRPAAAAVRGEALSTRERIRTARWWPTQATPQREDYVGSAACAGCHASEAAAQSVTPMAEAGGRATGSKILQAHPQMTFRDASYAYKLICAQGECVFSATAGANSASVGLGWAFGRGEVGETYVFERDGTYYEGRLSYFPVLKGLDITPGQRPSPPPDVDHAMGRPMEAAETRLCFGCHTTASSTGGRFDPARLIPGVTCEACHGPGAKHIAAIQAGRMSEALERVLNPARLDAADSVDFCGACHRAWADVMESGMHGIATVRFQPYRLELSRCWGSGDSRITCLACHDPHQPLVRDQSWYDQRCLGCHAPAQAKRTAAHSAAPCPRSAKNCASCHMPKFEVPGTHAQFTDHWIRVVRPNEPYPD